MKPEPSHEPESGEPEYIDRLIDVFLQEMLAGQTPPDLSERILDAYRQDQIRGAHPAQSTDMHVVPAIPISPPSHLGTPALPTSVPDGTGLDSHAPRLSDLPSGGSHQRSGVAFLLAVCSLGLLLLLGWRAGYAPHGGNEFSNEALSSNDRSNEPAGKQPGDTAEQMSPRPSENASVVAGSGDSRGVLSGEKTKTEVLDLGDLPFRPGPSAVAIQGDRDARLSASVDKLASSRIIAEIDGRFIQLWENLGVTPSPRYGDGEHWQRMLQTLVPRRPSETLQVPISQEFVHQEMRSAPFSQQWARRWLVNWFPNVDITSSQMQGLEKWLATQLFGRRPWNQIANELLAASLPREQGQSSGTPAATFIAALAGGENQQLVDVLGESFLNSKLTCVRCHNARNPSGAESDQSEYWSLVALFKGIDAGGSLTAGDRWATDQQGSLFAADKTSPTVFFDRPNGVLQAAEARLPDGQLWNAVASQTPRAALAQWIIQSDRFAEATVNQAWSMVFGRPLVPHSSFIESAGLAERQEVLQFIARQFKAHNYDFPRLVQWIVSTEAYALQPIQLDRARWLALAPAELDSYQLAELVFASGATVGRNSPISLDASLALVVDWSKNQQRLDTLAQPNLSPVSPANAEELQRLEPPSGYLLHAARPTLAQQNFVARLLRAKLSWEERVEHVVGLHGDGLDSPRIQQLAKMLLEHNGGDARGALHNLLWCVQNQGAT